MAVKELLAEHYADIMQRFHVKRMGLFGSCAHGDETSSSDVDILVEFEQSTFDNFMDMAFLP